MPSLDSTPGLLALAAIFFLAGSVKGVLGLGMPTVAMALLGFTMAPQRAAALLIVPALITNVWQTMAGPPLGPAVRRFWPLMVTICLGTWLGVVLLGSRLGGGATVLLGVVLAVYGAIGIASVRLTVPPASERWLAPLVGVLTGVLNAATGVSVIPLAPYLQSAGLPKEHLVQALGLCFLVAVVALGAGLTVTLKSDLALLDFVIPLAASLAGMAAGQAVRLRISADTFRRYFFIGLILLGSYLALRAW